MDAGRSLEEIRRAGDLGTVPSAGEIQRGGTPGTVLSVAQMRQADALAIAAGTPGRVLMERAGAAVAEAARGMAPAGARVLILCGPGNNGGDGFVAARLLAGEGYRVSLALLGARDALRGDAGLAAADWTGPVLPLADGLAEADLVIDALFGTGLSRDLDGEAARAVDWMNGSGSPVLAVDIPSGVDGDTGGVRGIAVRASATVTFARLKPGHLLLPGRALCGALRLADIGIPDSVIAELSPTIQVNRPGLWGGAFPRPAEDAHKYSRGHTLVLSGGLAQSGAARLAARGAARAGSGAVTLGCPASALAVNAAHLTAIMLRRCDDAAALNRILEDRRFTAVALGPGLGRGERARALLATAAAAGRFLVIDADAITSHEGEARGLGGVLAPAAGAVLTPHEGEFARLFEGEATVLEAGSKLARARAGAVLLGHVLVDKGPDTVIAAPDGRAAINANATPYLATAGSGDVLVGLIAGLMAQGMPPFEAACAGVWLHAETGRRLGPGLIAEDLPEALPGVLRELLGG